MSRWKAQRPVALQGSPGGESEVQTTGPDQRQSQRRGSAKQTGGVGMLLHHVDDFNLTPDQTQQLTKMQLDFELEKVDLEAALRKAKIRWRALIRDIDANDQEVLAAIDSVTACEGDLRRMRFNHLKTARGVLNPDQQAELRSFHLKQSRAKAQGAR